jgi:Flp pilus assembly protein TadG
MVEFAVVLPLVLLLFLGIFKLGILFNNYIVLTDAVRTGARQLAISRLQASPCTSATSRVKTSASDLNQTLINVTVCTSTLTLGQPATVEATYPCDLTILGINFFPSCTLRSSETERVE